MNCMQNLEVKGVLSFFHNAVFACIVHVEWFYTTALNHVRLILISYPHLVKPQQMPGWREHNSRS